MPFCASFLGPCSVIECLVTLNCRIMQAPRCCTCVVDFQLGYDPFLRPQLVRVDQQLGSTLYHRDPPGAAGASEAKRRRHKLPRGAAALGAANPLRPNREPRHQRRHQPRHQRRHQRHQLQSQQRAQKGCQNLILGVQQVASEQQSETVVFHGVSKSSVKIM